MFDPSTMVSGKKYWVRYRIPGLHRADRTMIARFLAVRGTELIFSGRPQFGSVELDKKHVLVVQEVKDHAECHVDRKA
jgi:hypothetical protein